MSKITEAYNRNDPLKVNVAKDRSKKLSNENTGRFIPRADVDPSRIEFFTTPTKVVDQDGNSLIWKYGKDSKNNDLVDGDLVDCNWKQYKYGALDQLCWKPDGLTITYNVTGPYPFPGLIRKVVYDEGRAHGTGECFYDTKHFNWRDLTSDKCKSGKMKDHPHHWKGNYRNGKRHDQNGIFTPKYGTPKIGEWHKGDPVNEKDHKDHPAANKPSGGGGGGGGSSSSSNTSSWVDAYACTV